MECARFPISAGIVLALLCSSTLAQPGVLKFERIVLAPEPRLTVQATVGTTNVIEYTDDLTTSQWHVLTNLVATDNRWVFVDGSASPSYQRFYRLLIPAITNALPNTNTPSSMVFIPAGSFEMGDAMGDDHGAELPRHTVYVSAFYMDPTEVTKALWDEVYQWAIGHGYIFDNPGSYGIYFGVVVQSKGTNHPVHSVFWYDVVKWCNARSEREGRVPAYYTSAAQTNVYRMGQERVQNAWVKWNVGYRLPTESEWERAARGGSNGHRFPWTNVDTITQNQANYRSLWQGGHPWYSYDVNPTEDYHPLYDDGGYPYTSPVGSFAANGYGLYDMAGNITEFCWDFWDFSYYGASPGINPRGPALSSERVVRGGSYGGDSNDCRVSVRIGINPEFRSLSIGFRSVLSLGE